MVRRNVAVFGTYRRPDDAEEAIGSLIIKGFPSETISALIPEDLAARGRKPEPIPVDQEEARHVVEKEIVRGTLGLLDHVAAVSVPNVGFLVGAGPLMSALTGVESAPPAGRIAAALEAMGAAPADARHYEKVLKRRAIVSVNCADSEWALRAKQVLARTGAERL